MTYVADNRLVAQGGCSRLVHQPVAHGSVSPPTFTGANVHHGLGGEFGFLRRTYGVSSWLKYSISQPQPPLAKYLM